MYTVGTTLKSFARIQHKLVTAHIGMVAEQLPHRPAGNTALLPMGTRSV